MLECRDTNYGDSASRTIIVYLTPYLSGFSAKLGSKAVFVFSPNKPARASWRCHAHNICRILHYCLFMFLFFLMEHLKQECMYMPDLLTVVLI